MPYLEIAFWACASCALYTYFLYPLFIALLACLCGRRTRPSGRRPRSVSFVLAAHNEAALVARRLEELTTLIAAAGVEGEIIVVSDGSTDATAEEARRHAYGTVQVLSLAGRHGKAVALTRDVRWPATRCSSSPTCGSGGRPAPCAPCWTTSPIRPSAR